MATVNVNFRIDEDLKREADKLFSDLGLNMSVAVTMFLKAAVNAEGIPFDIKELLLMRCFWFLLNTMT